MPAVNVSTIAYTLVVVLEWNDQQEALHEYGILNVMNVAENGPFVAGKTFSRGESLWIVQSSWSIQHH